MASSLRNAIRRLAGQNPGHFGVVDLDRLTRNWNFRPSRTDYISAIRRPFLLRNAVRAPDNMTIKPAYFGERWSVYFIYSPGGTLTPAHRFTLERLSANTELLVVFASSSPDDIPSEVSQMADALYWKALPGFDFSGYTLALTELAARSPGCDVLVMNDSVYGPLCDVDRLWPMMRWDLTGFTASSSIENHIQSYAFMLTDWDTGKARHLNRIFDPSVSFSDYEEVVFCQESRLARIASRRMTVGALWFADYGRCADAPVYAALSLAEDGFPFLKRSLLTKHAHVNDIGLVRDILARNEHPQP